VLDPRVDPAVDRPGFCGCECNEVLPVGYRDATIVAIESEN
jgi:hypothetical protein